MASKLGGGEDDLIADINITPFVDIILVVLIIFMVTATTIVKQAIPVTLPEAASGSEVSSESLAFTLDVSGALLLDGAPVDAAAAQQAIRAAKARSREVVVLIAADKQVSHGRVVWLLDLVKSEGVAKFAINIDKATAVPPDPGR